MISKKITSKTRIVKNKLKQNLIKIKKEKRGQGAAEYILLLAGALVVAIVALTIYSSYFKSSQSGLNATDDIQTIRRNISI